MLKRGINGRRLGFAIGLVAAGVIGVVGVAVAAPATIVGTGDDEFTPTTYTQDQGDLSVLQVTGSNHNATATPNGPDGKALFRSATITGGTTPVNGTQYLTTGSYQFICTIHPSTMQATLNVTANGTPQPRPRISLKLQSRKLEKVAKKGKLLVAVTSNASVGDVSLEAKLGKSTLVSAPGLALVAGQQTEVLKLNRKARRKLAARKKATIVLNGTVAFGSPATAKGKLK
jgi:plastocyanin